MPIFGNGDIDSPEKRYNIKWIRHWRHYDWSRRHWLSLDFNEIKHFFLKQENI
jgi:hypothetical protein